MLNRKSEAAIKRMVGRLLQIHCAAAEKTLPTKARLTDGTTG